MFYYYPNIIANESFGDFDNNGITDFAFIDASNPSRIMISEFRDSINNFTTIFDMPTPGDNLAGIAIGDFDEDRKTDLVFSTGLHGVYVIESEDTNQYSVVWRGPAPSVAAYMLTSTKDIDSNGRPEFWVGGLDFTTGISTFWCYEADGDNSYIPVAGFELRYLVSLFSFCLQAADMDNDGVEELVIDIGDYLLISKFRGKPNQHSYDIFYAKIDEATQPVQFFPPATIRDFNKDGRKDILLSMAVWPPPYLSYILVQDIVTSVADIDMHMPGDFNLSQNYPNPFNPSTQVNYSIKEAGLVQLKVYDILGKEIATLVNENKPAGNYEAEFNTSTLPSGMYIYKIQAGNFVQSRKMLLIK